MKKFSVIFFALMLALFCAACGTTPDCDPELDDDCKTDDPTGHDTDDQTDDPAVTDVDEPTVTDTDEPTEPTGIITRIQKGEIPVDTEVTTECVVTAVFKKYDNDAKEYTVIKGLYVSELIDKAQPYSGIYVYVKEAPLDKYQVGDKLEVTGKYTEYNESSQIEATEIKPLGSADLPEPAEITESASIATPFDKDGNPTANHGEDTEAYESVLVKVNNVKITNTSLDTHGLFEVTGNLAIDKTFYYYPKEKRIEGREFESITGILTYSFKAFRLAPRSEDDIVEGPEPTEPTVEPTEPTVDPTDPTVDPTIEPVTIKEIQKGNAKNKLVRIENAIVISNVISNPFNDATKYDLYVSDGTKGDYSGVSIYHVSSDTAIAKGDKVTIEGLVNFYGTHWQIKGVDNADSITKTGTGTVPAALEKAYTALSDKDKGTLIEITDELTVKSVETPEGKNYTKITFEEKVKNGEEEKELIAENFGNVTFPAFQAGDKLHVKGIYDTIFGSNGFYIIDANDIDKRIY